MAIQIAKGIRPLVLGLILSASHARTFSLIHGYSAPLEIYKHFEHHDDAGEGKGNSLLKSYYVIASIKLSYQFLAWKMFIAHLSVK